MQRTGGWKQEKGKRGQGEAQERRTAARKTAAVLARGTESAQPSAKANPTRHAGNAHYCTLRADRAPGPVLATGGIKRKVPGPALEKVKPIWSSS